MEKRAKIYAVVNRKGGVGKTTTAVTLGYGLAKLIEGQGHVLIVDLDPQGNVATSLGLAAAGQDIAGVLTGEVPVEQAILHADRSQGGGPARPNLWVLPASDALADAKLTLVANAALSTVLDQFGGRAAKAVPTDQLLQTYLAKAVATFDYIILLGVGGAARHTQDIIEAQAEGINIRVGVIVPTFVRAREILARQMLKALIDSYGKSRVAVPIPQSVVVEQAPASGGLTVLEYAPESVPAQAYWRLVKKVHNGQI